MKANILIIEDEPEISELISLYLSKEGIETVECRDGESGLTAVSRKTIDLIILDINLPGIDGYEVLQTLRKEYNIPVIIVSARTDDEDMILGFGFGADDFVQKPFSPKVLAARVRAHLRRKNVYNSESRSIHFGPFTLEPKPKVLWRNGDRISLSPKETELLILLAENRGSALSSDELYTKVWGNEYGELTTVAVHIQRLRKKIEDDPASPRYITTIHGFGYMLSSEEEL